MKRKFLGLMAFLMLFLSGSSVMAAGPQHKMTDLKDKVERKKTKPGTLTPRFQTGRNITGPMLFGCMVNRNVMKRTGKLFIIHCLTTSFR